jgi:hypothetical protein
VWGCDSLVVLGMSVLRCLFRGSFLCLRSELPSLLFPGCWRGLVSYSEIYLPDTARHVRKSHECRFPAPNLR